MYIKKSRETQAHYMNFTKFVGHLHTRTEGLGNSNFHSKLLNKAKMRLSLRFLVKKYFRYYNYYK